MKQINFIVTMSNHNNVSLIDNILLNLGIVSHNIDKPSNVIDFLEKVKIDFIFLDLDFANGSSLDLLESLANNDNYSSIYILTTSFNTNEKFIKELQKYNILSFLTKPITKESIETVIEHIMEKFKNHFPARKHVRVKPSENELMRISFKLKSKKNITAKVLDISLGGVAALLYTKCDDIELSPGNLIEHLTFEAMNKEIDVDAKIVNVKENFIAFKFSHFYNNTNKALARYIMKKLKV